MAWCYFRNLMLHTQAFMHKSWLIIFLFFFASVVHAQKKSLPFTLQVVLNGKLVQSHEPLIINEKGDSMTISKLKFYLSNFVLKREGQPIKATLPQYFLFDLDDSVIDHQSKNAISWDGIDFVFGVDSSTQAAGVMDGVLDPLNGMYWTWQSGYIHFKLEGTLNCIDGTKQNLSLHLGGYRYPNNSIKMVSLLSVDKVAPNIIELDVTELLQQVQIKQQYHIMSPGNMAIELSEILAHSFRFSQP